ncbi:hypothetical protein, partial [Pseudomonas syringae group genomosp. 3]|uniref:hypothetical protein n=1 Tax=Pseudomonas syringae group genomosp. 3 TaxID=251701 RepID=UPI001C81ABAC
MEITGQVPTEKSKAAALLTKQGRFYCARGFIIAYARSLNASTSARSSSRHPAKNASPSGYKTFLNFIAVALSPFVKILFIKVLSYTYPT